LRAGKKTQKDSRNTQFEEAMATVLCMTVKMETSGRSLIIIFLMMKKEIEELHAIGSNCERCLNFQKQ